MSESLGAKLRRLPDESFKTYRCSTCNAYGEWSDGWQLLQWRPGRSAVEQTAIMREHAVCPTCLDNHEVVIGWDHGNAVWSPCPDCLTEN